MGAAQVDNRHDRTKDEGARRYPTSLFPISAPEVLG